MVNSSALSRSITFRDIWPILREDRDNITALRTTIVTSWVPSPELRGTISILQSCLLTLVACVYTALHLNVPRKTDWKHVLLTKLKWVVLTVLAPEVVLFSAAEQLMRARKLVKELRDLQGKSNVADQKFVFDLKYAFVVIMGGLRIPLAKLSELVSLDDMDIDQRELYEEMTASVEHRASLIVTSSGVLMLARFDHWIYLADASVGDKSKANPVQKALVLVQILWMAMQCVSRASYGLPITLLELHTMVHVVCAVMLYTFWFKKPLDIQDPILTFDETWSNCVSVMLQQSLYRGQARNYLHYIQDNADPVIYCEGSSPDLGHEPGRSSSAFERVRHTRLYMARHEVSAVYEASFVLRMEQLDRLIESDYGRVALSACDRMDDKHNCGVSLDKLLSTDETEIDDVPLALVSTNGDFRSDNNFLYIGDARFLIRLTPGTSLLGIVLPLVYAGIHLGAWDFRFPTQSEALCWKIACFDIAVTMPILLVLDLGRRFIWTRRMQPSYETSWVRHIENAAWITFLYGTWTLLTGYLTARTFIIVESFISLRSVPIGVYLTPSWLQMIPHF